jgi:NADH-quinone oxidoreductase subunit N
MMYLGLLEKNSRIITYAAIAGVFALLVLNVAETYGSPVWNFQAMGMLATSRYGLLLNSIMLFSCMLYFIVSGADIEKIGRNAADYYALIFFVFAGIGILTSFTSLLMLFLGVEIVSIPLYVLTGADKRNLKGNEAALKYLLMGSFSTGIMLMGIALIYGGSGTFAIEKLSVAANTQVSYNLIGGLLLLLVAMSFKVSAVPFHFWTPDVYDGAPTVFTSFMATIVKVAAFAGFIRVFEGPSTLLANKWQLVLAIIIALTLLVGNITAVFQHSVKRMLAYSSIAQAGFMLFALFAFNVFAREGIVLYAAAYSLSTIGIFAVLARMHDYTYDGFNGLGKSEPLLALVLTVFLLSLAGIPLTVGFFSKYFMLASALATGGKYLWLSILAVLCAAISVYYYFKVIQAMYFKQASGQTVAATTPYKAGLLLLAVLVILLGVLPQMLLQYLYF